MAEPELVGEMWRYQAITRGPRVPRPDDWFFLGEYVAIKIDDVYIAGRVIEISGNYPPIIKACMYQGRNLCSDHPDNCDSICRKRLLTSVDNGAVLNGKDVLRLFDRPEDFGLPVLSHEEIEELFDRIERLEKRQSRRRQS